MELNSLSFIQLIQEKLLLEIMKIASSPSKSNFDDSQLESPGDNADNLIRLALECILVWSQTYSNNFKEIYDCLVQQGVDFPKTLVFFKEQQEIEENTLIERNLRIHLCKTEILTTSNNEEINLFILENKMDMLNNILESNETCEFQSIYI